MSRVMSWCGGRRVAPHVRARRARAYMRGARTGTRYSGVRTCQGMACAAQWPPCVPVYSVHARQLQCELQMHKVRSALDIVGICVACVCVTVVSCRVRARRAHAPVAMLDGVVQCVHVTVVGVGVSASSVRVAADTRRLYVYSVCVTVAICCALPHRARGQRTCQATCCVMACSVCAWPWPSIV